MDYNFISAGIHHLILDQNLKVLKKLLIPDDILSRMLNQENKEYVLSTDEQEEQIQRFTECLQSCPLKDYKNFYELLYKTMQHPLMAKLSASCKNLPNITTKPMLAKLFSLNYSYITIGPFSVKGLNCKVFVSKALPVNQVVSGAKFYN